MLSRLLCLFLIYGCLGTASFAQLNHASAQLRSQQTAVVAGGTIDIALVFTIEPGWHLYWLNPGETGLPPSVKWQLPPGVAVSPLEFPTPHRIKMNGLTTFGYENELVLLAKVQLPKEIAGEIKLKGTADWLVCKESCVSESSNIELTVQIGDQKDSADAQNFVRWREAVPSVAKTKSIFSVNLAAKRGAFQVSVPSDAEKIDLFPPAAGFAVYEEPKVEGPDPGQPAAGKVVTVPFRVLPSEIGPVNDFGIVTYTRPEGGKVSYKVQVDYRPAQ